MDFNFLPVSARIVREPILAIIHFRTLPSTDSIAKPDKKRRTCPQYCIYLSINGLDKTIFVNCFLDQDARLSANDVYSCQVRFEYVF